VNFYKRVGNDVVTFPSIMTKEPGGKVTSKMLIVIYLNEL